MRIDENYIRQALGRAMNGLRMMLGRGRITLTNENEQGGTQFVQARLSAQELMDLPRLAEFGFVSRVPEKGDCVVVFLNAERSMGVVIATGHQSFRFKLENDGETAIHDAFGKSIWLKKEGGIVIEAADQPVTINGVKGVTINNSDEAVTLNLDGSDVILNDPGAVQLTGAGGRKVVCDGDPVSGGVVHADPDQKVTAT
jgi:phage baseplate assembly protein V